MSLVGELMESAHPNADRENTFEYAQRRKRMVDDQLRRRGIFDAGVLQAMSTVPRECFVPQSYRHEAYEDWPLPIGYGQTISQPFTVAFMAQALQLVGGEKVLEIGTGSGYAAAILAGVAREVHTVERIPELAEKARQRLAHLGFQNIHVHTSDGTLGWVDQSPYEAIVVTAGANQLPSGLVDQLADGGRLVIPIGKQPTSQILYRFHRHADHLEKEVMGPFAFVPLVGKDGWSDKATT